MKKDSGQALVIVLFIIIIFTLVVVTIASLTTREVELREIDEMAAKAEYVAESGEERARYVLKGSALKFDGIDDYIEFSSYYGIGGSNPRTVEAWIKTNVVDVNQSIVNWGSDATGTRYNFRIDGVNGNTLRIEVAGGYEYGTTNLADGKWHHVVTTFSGSDVTDHQFYVDGSLEGVGASGSTTVNTSTTSPVWIGSDPYFSRYMNGIIDEVRIYNRALESEEIIDHYNGKYTNESGLVLLQHFEEGPNYCDIKTLPTTACLIDDSNDSENEKNGTPNGFDSNIYDAQGTPDSGWTRNYPYERSVFIGSFLEEISGLNLFSCPDSRFKTSEHSCEDKNIIGDYYYNVTITRRGDQRPDGKGPCNQLICIDSSGQNVE
jgi:hypothetical protein